MIQAHLRGLLARKLPFGSRSRLREDILLGAIEADMAGASADRFTAVTASMLGGAKLEPNSRKNILHDMLVDLRLNDLIRVADLDHAAEFRFENSSLASATVYDIVKRAGLVTGEDANPEAEY